jgi:hypothetical protein
MSKSQLTQRLSHKRFIAIIDYVEVYYLLSSLLNINDECDELKQVVESAIFVYFVKYTKEDEAILASRIFSIDRILEEYVFDESDRNDVINEIFDKILELTKLHIPVYNERAIDCILYIEKINNLTFKLFMTNELLNGK